MLPFDELLSRCGKRGMERMGVALESSQDKGVLGKIGIRGVVAMECFTYLGNPCITWLDSSLRQRADSMDRTMSECRNGLGMKSQMSPSVSAS